MAAKSVLMRPKARAPLAPLATPLALTAVKSQL